MTTISAPGAEGATECVASDPAVPAAYAVIAGIDVADLPGTQFLIDGGGWLRSVQRRGDPSWNDPAILAAVIHDIDAHPVTAANSAAMPMRM